MIICILFALMKSLLTTSRRFTDSYKIAIRYSSNKSINLKDKSSREWLLRQMTDKYVKMAKTENWRCRSAFKLLEINARYKILQPGMSILDCGAAPGSWSQVAAKLVNSKGILKDQPIGFVLSIDRDFFQPIEGCVCVRSADFTSDKTRNKIIELLHGRKIDVFLSDMAPNATGHKEMDHEQILSLDILALDFAQMVLKEKGTFLCKLLEGGRTKHFHNMLATVFDDVKFVKPDASRVNSAEIFLLARGYANPRLHVNE